MNRSFDSLGGEANVPFRPHVMESRRHNRVPPCDDGKQFALMQTGLQADICENANGARFRRIGRQLALSASAHHFTWVAIVLLRGEGFVHSPQHIEDVILQGGGQTPEERQPLAGAA